LKIKIPILFLIAFLFILLTECNKKDEPLSNNSSNNNLVYGKVVDAVSNTGVSGAHVMLINSSGGYPSVLNLIADTITDANGNFVFSPVLKGIDVQATADKYFDSQLYSIYDNQFKQSHILTIDPQTYLKFHIVNSLKTYHNIQVDATIKGAGISLGGDNVDTIITGSICDATISKIGYWLTNTNEQKRVYIPINTNRFDTTFIQINY